MGYEECRSEITAKPFHRDFDEQLDAANELYGCYLEFEVVAARADRIVDEIEKLYREGQSDSWYTRVEAERVRSVLRYQARKYGYMFGK